MDQALLDRLTAIPGDGVQLDVPRRCNCKMLECGSLIPGRQCYTAHNVYYVKAHAVFRKVHEILPSIALTQYLCGSLQIPPKFLSFCYAQSYSRFIDT